jgi:hypothetical protein
MPTEETGTETEGLEPTPGTDPSNTDPWASPEVARAEIEKLRRENAGWRTQVRDLKPLAEKAKEQDEASKSEIQKALDRATEAERKAQETTLEAARLRAASAHGLTEAQADRLKGSTPEELLADAKAYAAELGANGRKPADLKQGARGSSTPDDPNAWLRRMAGR